MSQLRSRHPSLLRALVLAAAALGAATLGGRAFAADEISHQVVTPSSFDGDLRRLPRAPAWRPGDPIRDIPRRRRPPPNGLTVTPAAPQVDPLLALAERGSAAARGSDAGFGSPLLDFTAQGFSGVNPADPVGDVGGAYYLQAINSATGASVVVYDKVGGAALAGPFLMEDLGGTGACAVGSGDPIILYDELAARWLLSEFSSLANALCVYVSKTSDPIQGGWWAYTFATPNFPDYPKYAVWPTGYFVGTNESSPAIYALERAQMLDGGAAVAIRRTLPVLDGFGFQAVTPADYEGPAAPPDGTPAHFLRHRDDEVHDAPGTPSDFLDLFTFTPNYALPILSQLTGPTSLPVTDFDSDLCGLFSFNCFPMPGTGQTLDPLREVVMWRLGYHFDGAVERLVGNFVTDVTGLDRGGIRWFVLEQTGGGGFSLAEEGTYSPDATNRWMGALARDVDGNLAVAYAVSSAAVFPGLRYAGRLADDPAGSLPQGEHSIVEGTASNASNRWGDYFSLNLDAEDGCTFYFTGGWSPASTWSTRIASFRFDACAPEGLVFRARFERNDLTEWPGVVGATP